MVSSFLLISVYSPLVYGFFTFSFVDKASVGVLYSNVPEAV